MGPNRTADDAACTYNPWSSKYASSGHGYANEDLIVWMRTAALPTFRKLYRKVTGAIDSDAEYKITVGYNFPVASFKGEKRFILSTTSNIGGKNPFLGAAYLVVAKERSVANLALSPHRPDSTDGKGQRSGGCAIRPRVRSDQEGIPHDPQGRVHDPIPHGTLPELRVEGEPRVREG